MRVTLNVTTRAPLTVLARSVRVALVLAERGRLPSGDGRRGLVRLARRAVERHHPVVRVL